MIRYRCLKLGILFVCVAVAACAAGEKPNILLVLIDDMGWKDISCTGSTYYETPHIDQLVTDGMRFLNAYSAAPACPTER